MVQCELPGIPKLRSGKVREMFDLGEQLLMVATDRISAFDVILPDPIPGKGEVLTQLSLFWFRQLAGEVEHHLITADVDDYPASLHPFQDQLRGRSMLVVKTDPIPVECVVRGYLAGSGWKEYLDSGTVCGIALPSGMVQAERLPEPIFTPAAKNHAGHDENISWEEFVEKVGEKTAKELREVSRKIYEIGARVAAEAGIVIADTKFEFGYREGRLILIDECLTPDSSRFWPRDTYQPGTNPPSFDKQFIRDYLETLEWDKTDPGPELPAEILEQTGQRYREALLRLTGEI